MKLLPIKNTSIEASMGFGAAYVKTCAICWIKLTRTQCVYFSDTGRANHMTRRCGVTRRQDGAVRKSQFFEGMTKIQEFTDHPLDAYARRSSFRYKWQFDWTPINSMVQRIFPMEGTAIALRNAIPGDVRINERVGRISHQQWNRK